MTKLATSIEESKRLLEVGIDPKSADMCWTNASFKGVNYVDPWRLNPLTVDEVEKTLSTSDSLIEWAEGWEIVPAWSLSVLMRILLSTKPLRFSFEKSSDVDKFVCDYANYGYGVRKMDDDLISLCVNILTELIRKRL